MHWEKKGLLFKLDRRLPWMQSHAQVPIAMPFKDSLRIFFATRDIRNRTVTTYIDVQGHEDLEIVSAPQRVSLGLGAQGCFDDAGAMPSWIVERDNQLWLYYIGWSLAVSVPYRLAIGLAISKDQGKHFERYAEGPIFERNPQDACWVSNPCVVRHSKTWRMYYIGCTRWQTVKGHPEPWYTIKVIESDNGIDWHGKSHCCFEYTDRDHAFARPFVYEQDGIYKMLYCVRGTIDFRTDPNSAYRMGYAESRDGLHWERKDQLMTLHRSEYGWDSQMVAYPYLIRWKKQTFLFYNGNSFGYEGFGYAVLRQ